MNKLSVVDEPSSSTVKMPTQDKKRTENNITIEDLQDIIFNHKNESFHLGEYVGGEICTDWITLRINDKRDKRDYLQRNDFNR